MSITGLGCQHRIPLVSSTVKGTHPGPPPSAARPWRIIGASVVGTTIEFSDFFVYATAAVLVFPTVFFPGSNPTTALLSSLAVFGTAFVARPIGGLLFGSLGDRIGRRRTLMLTLMTMGVATVGIGLLPAATEPGWGLAAPALLVVLRFCQGVGLGGEWSGAALLATENAPRSRTSFYSVFPQLGASLGFAFATASFLILSATLTNAEFLAWGWRIPFLASAVLIIVGLWIRRSLQETPAFRSMTEHNTVERAPLRRVLLHSPGALFVGIVMPITAFALSYLLTTFAVSYATATPSAFPSGLGINRDVVLVTLIGGIVLLAAATLLSAPLIDRAGRRRYLVLLNIAVIILGMLLMPLTDLGTGGALAALAIGFILAGLALGPLPAVLTELFPLNLRYSGSAVAYNTAGILGAALAPFIAVALWHATDNLLLVGAYLATLAAISLIAVAVSPAFANRTNETGPLTNEG